MASDAKQSYMKEAISLLGSTIPLMGLNAAIYIGFFIASVIWTAAWVGLAVVAAMFIHEFVGLFIGLVFLGMSGWLWRMAKRYLLYLVKGAHIAAMTEIMCGRDVPKGAGQIAYGRDIVKKYFRDVSMLFGLDIIIKAVVRRLTGTVVRILGALPLPQSARKAVNAIRKIINRSLGYMDAAILSYAIKQREENVWQSARHGIILYAQSYKGILITSFKVWVVAKVFEILIFAMILIPVGLLAAAFEMQIIFWAGFVVAIAGARLLDLAFYEPFALAYVMVTFHRETEGMTPDPEWDRKLQGASDKFKELVGKAESYVPQKIGSDGQGQGLQSGDQVQMPQQQQ